MIDTWNLNIINTIDCYILFVTKFCFEAKNT